MRKLLLVVGLAVCMAGIASAEMLSNPGFEGDFSVWSHWGSGSGSGNWGWSWSGNYWANVIDDRDVALSGDKFDESGFWIDWNYMNWWGWGYSMVWQEPDVVVGETYTMSAWVRDGWSDFYGGTIPAQISWEWRGAEDVNNDGRGDILDRNGNGIPNENADKIYTSFEVPKDESWVFISDTQVAPEGAVYVTAIINNSTYNSNLYIDNVSLITRGPYHPEPVNGGVVTVDVDTLSWVNPEPNSPGDIITCDVYWSDTHPDDPNFTLFAEKIVDNEAIDSFKLSERVPPIDLEFGETYYWRVHCRAPGVAGEMVGNIWSFRVDNTKPDVEAGDNEYEWLTDGGVVVNLDATVTDDDHPDPPAISLEWTVTDGDTDAIVITDPAVEDAEVTITAAGRYRLKLTADDSERIGTDSVVITVYETACEATKASGIELPATDINEDCAVNIIDLALMAENFGGCMSYDCL